MKRMSVTPREVKPRYAGRDISVSKREGRGHIRVCLLTFKEEKLT
jgi:hypothetical protein